MIYGYGVPLQCTRRPEVRIEEDAKSLTIYVNSTDQWHGQPLYAAIVQLCRERGVAGATVTPPPKGMAAADGCTPVACWN